MPRNPSQRALTVGLVLLLLAGATGVGSTVAVQDDQQAANVRAIHVLPFLPGLDVFVEGDPVVLNLSFGDVAGYQPFAAGESDVEIVVNETGEEIFEGEATLEAGVNYTIVAVGTLEDGTVQFQPSLLKDELRLPSEGNASLRFVHASPDAPQLDLIVEGVDAAVARNVTYRDDSGYVELPAGNYTLEVREAAGDPGEVLVTRNVSLVAGTASSAIAVGFVDPEAVDTEFSLAVALSEDGRVPAARATPTPGAGNQTATPGAGNRTATPGVGNQTATPGAGNRTATPGVGNQTATPGAGNQTVIETG